MIANIAVSIVATVLFVAYPHRRQKISLELLCFTLLTFILIPVLLSGSLDGASYLVSFLVVYIISQGTITRKVIATSGNVIALGGLVILYVYANGDLLSGWNDNSISMMGLFSFIYYSIYILSKKGHKAFWALSIIVILYLQLMFQTDCRSGMLFVVIAVLGIIYSDRTNHILSRKKMPFWVVNAPLILAFVVIAISATPMFDALDQWSLENSEKGIFDDRDVLWDAALALLQNSYYLGTGKFAMNYHNSGIAALSVFGVIGYICWAKYFINILKRLQIYLYDKIVFGSILAFTLIFLQQSLDLGFIGSAPNLIPYIILGIGLGRERMLKIAEK